MINKDKALKLALEALEGLFGTTEQFEGGSVAVWRLGGSAQPKQAITAIKAALAQPVQEPHEYDWSMLEAAKESLREHMTRIKELEAASKQALEALETSTDWNVSATGRQLKSMQAITALRTRLAQPPLPVQPQRPWVGLTDEEYDEIWRMDLNNKELMDKTIIKLKEKNNGT